MTLLRLGAGQPDFAALDFYAYQLFADPVMAALFPSQRQAMSWDL